MQKAYRILRMAVLALRRNALRSALTTLGIIIGVSAVIVMIEIGQGAAKAIQRTIASMGANNLLIQPGAGASGGVSFGQGTQLTLTPEDAEAVLQHCDAIENVAPMVRVRTQVVYGNRNWVPPFIYGTSPAYLDVRDWQTLDEGDVFTDRDVRNWSKVCLVGRTLARELFQGESPIGKEVRVQNVPLKVVGLLSRKGANMMGMDQDDILLAPWTTIKFRVSGVSATAPNQSAVPASDDTSSQVNTLSQLYPVTRPEALLYPQPSLTQLVDTPQGIRFTNIDQILAKVRSAPLIPAAQQQITELLRERHRIRPGLPNDFNIRDMSEIGGVGQEQSQTMSTLLLVLALVALVVGGVGIMNIMLVSVTERTREIGLRMAVGARPRDILRQFLVEAVVLCLSGGIVGILVGRGGSILVRRLLNWPTEVSLIAAVAAVVVSFAVGVIFGYYPAWKASRLDPIEALRYE
jgi:ABC-type antimicrobial peptide transport system permease subunit